LAESLSLRVPDEFKEAVDDYCASIGITHSELIKQLLYEEMQAHNFAAIDKIQDYMEYKETFKLGCVFKNAKKFIDDQPVYINLLMVSKRQFIANDKNGRYKDFSQGFKEAFKSVISRIDRSMKNQETSFDEKTGFFK
jgi:hypothetical protein